MKRSRSAGSVKRGYTFYRCNNKRWKSGLTGYSIRRDRIPDILRFVLSATVLAQSSNSSIDEDTAHTKQVGFNGGRQFHMTLQFPGPKVNRRGLVYITDQGYITTHQSEATVFSIHNGQLTSDGKIVSADLTDAYIPFAPDSTVHSISTTWTQSPSLAWTNSAFAGKGVATYCQGSDSRVYLVLQSPPSECKPAVASPVPLPSTTATSTTATSTTANSTPATSITATSTTATSTTATSATATSTSTSSAPTPTVQGLAYYGYKNPNNERTPSSYNPNTNVDISGIVQDIYFVLDHVGNSEYNHTFPGQNTPVNAEHYSIVYQGFFRANDSGTYILTATSNTDDNFFIWVGNVAYTAWGDNNYNDSSKIFQKDASITVTVNAGDLIPVTFLWINIGGAGALYFNIFDVNSGVDVSDTTGYFLAPVEGDGFSEAFVPNPPVPTPPDICPGQNGGTVTVGGNPYFIQCGISYASLAISQTTATSLTDCFAKCNSYQGQYECVTASYSKSGGQCYLSNYRFGGVITVGTDSGTSET